MDSSITILEKREHTVRAARILVVEDERIVAMSLRKQLSKLGYEIVGHAPSGTEAIQKAGELRPDVVLMDIHLEGAMDGVAAARQIRDLFQIPVVYLTAYSNNEILERAKVTEPFGYILKPYSGRELHVVIEMALYRHQMERRLEIANARLQVLSTTDELTGLKNRRAFQEKLNDEFGRVTRYALPLSLLMLDLDHFKDFNDTFGHVAGDTILRRLGAVLQKAKRSTDFVARFGGEEFAVLLTNTDREGALVSGERFRRVVAKEQWQGRSVTVSIGASTLGMDAKDGGTLVLEADAALYYCKAHGRNCVFHASQIKCESVSYPRTHLKHRAIPGGGAGVRLS